MWPLTPQALATLCTTTWPSTSWTRVGGLQLMDPCTDAGGLRMLASQPVVPQHAQPWCTWRSPSSDQPHGVCPAPTSQTSPSTRTPALPSPTRRLLRAVHQHAGHEPGGGGRRGDAGVADAAGRQVRAHGGRPGARAQGGALGASRSRVGCGLCGEEGWAAVKGECRGCWRVAPAV